MQNIKTTAVKALLEIEDKISEIWKDDDWATAEALQEVISEHLEKSKLLIRCHPFGSEYMHSTQGFHFELLGEKNILSFASSNSEPKSRLQFEQFLSKCLEEVQNINNSDIPINDVIIRAFERRSLPNTDIELLLGIRNELQSKGQKKGSLESYALEEPKAPGKDVIYYNSEHWTRTDTNSDECFRFEATKKGLELLENDEQLSPIEFYCIGPDYVQQILNLTPEKIER